MIAVLVLGSVAVDQTAWQLELFHRVALSAEQKSREAEAPLVKLIDSQSFREGLKACCPSVSGLPAKDLLKRVQEELRVSEVVSAFPAADGEKVWWDMSISEGYRGEYFENQWQVHLLHNASFSKGQQGLTNWFGTQDDVETRLYGLKPYTKRGQPASLDEASERGPYCLVNALRADAGSPLYGAVSAVFSPRLMRETALLSAVDTGSFEGMCNRSDGASLGLVGSVGRGHTPKLDVANMLVSNPLMHDCSKYLTGPDHLGTIEHFNHLLLMSNAYWNGTESNPLLRIIARIVAEPENKIDGWGTGYELKGPDFIHYFEAIPAVTLRFPQSVKFLIGSFTQIFGTVEGQELIQWCRARRWALVWSLGLNVDDVGHGGLNFFSAPFLNGSFPSNQRLLDASVLEGTSASLNLTMDGQGQAAFSETWSEVEQARASAALERKTVNSTQWNELWIKLRARLPSELRLEPLRARSCADEEQCLGTNELGQCVCYSGRESGAVSATTVVV